MNSDVPAVIETIGSVRLHKEYYAGEDRYSEGQIEDELLMIAENVPAASISEEIAARDSWSVTYHFSPLRGNIIRACPYLSGAKVLEIGAGCGAVTGTIAEQASSVVCVELSRRRSLVNAARNRERTNLEIYLGNFVDVEPHLADDFDIVTLIGVLEYGKAFIDSDTAFRDLIVKALSHLRPGGRLLIAIENRLGLKYFAGCAEDHTGRPFDGIEGYPEGDVRTFSKPELERLLKESGALSWEFFYPYPDYKFPTAMYSDRYLPRPGSLTENTGNADRSRLILFDEKKAFDSLLQDGLFPLFSNSFLVEVLRA